MARFKRDTLTWTLSQRRRFCGHANSLLRSLKKPERLELHYSGNKLNFRVGLVDARGRRNVLQEENAQNEYGDDMNQENVYVENANAAGVDMNQENVYVENANAAGDDMNQDNETVSRRRHVRRVNRRTTRQQERRRSPSGETSELGVSIKNKERMIRKKNLDIRSEKKKMYTKIPDFHTFAKMISTMKLVLEELPLASKQIKLLELQKEAENNVKNLLGVDVNPPLGVDENIIHNMVSIFSLLMKDLLLNNEDGGVFLSSKAFVGVPFSEELVKLRTDVEQLRTEKEALENRLNEIVQR